MASPPESGCPEKVSAVSVAIVEVDDSCNWLVITWQTRSGRPSPFTSCVAQAKFPLLPVLLTEAPDKVIVDGSTCVVALKVGLLRMATGSVFELRLIVTGACAGGLMLIVTDGI